MADAVVSNGTETPHVSQVNGYSLTEYATDPTTPAVKANLSPHSLIPEELCLPDGFPDYLRLILTSRVYEAVEETPLTHAINISNRLECKVLLKREDLQPVFSFKLRGAYNKMAHLTPTERWKGVIACSAGNHAQGVAYSARKLKIPATIVMPSGTPTIKHHNVSRLGGLVVLHGDDFDSAKAEAHRLEKLHGLTNIAPFDDPYVIAGQGTIGLELLRQTNLQQLEAIFCCVGGGGLIAGIGVYIKRIAPHVKIIGVESFDANAMVQSLEARKRVVLSEVGLFADGAAVKAVGEETFRLCSEVVDEIIQVTTDETCAAIKDVFEDTRSIVEPAGALALAGLKKWVAQNPSPNTDRILVATASGANMNFDRLRFVSERAALGEKKEALLSIRIRERAGEFAKLVKTVMPHTVTEFSYRYSSKAKEWARIIMGIGFSDRNAHLPALLARLENSGMSASDLSDSELAKTHIRYMAGSRNDEAENERLYSFEFPERPGALVKFLTNLPTYDISLFHYRNHGGDVAKILAGIICEPSKKEELEGLLKGIGYGFADCTDDEAYRLFLRE
ncbi:MAG: hypothetical protein M1836_003524 [Candelina mexicana]|nr:MAG: hypothetical protein M1836_003524 [Candelina mexicana]